MKLIKLIFSIVLILNFLNAKEINPSFTYITKGGITDLVIEKNKLYASTDASSVDIFDVKTKTKVNSIVLEKINDFMGDKVHAKIYSVDVLKDKVLILSQGQKGGRNIFISKDDKLKNIILDTQNLYIAKAKFINEKQIVFALLSNEIVLFDLEKKEEIKKVHVSQSKFSDFVLTQDKNTIIISDESGDLKMLDTSNLELVRTFENQNLDNVFQVDTKSGLILTAGQDRRSVVYSTDGKSAYYKKSSFLIYSVGLSPSGKLAAYASNEENDVSIFNTQSKNYLHTLVGNPATLSKILFLNEKEVFVSSDHAKINYYKID